MREKEEEEEKPRERASAYIHDRVPPIRGRQKDSRAVANPVVV